MYFAMSMISGSYSLDTGAVPACDLRADIVEKAAAGRVMVIRAAAALETTGRTSLAEVQKEAALTFLEAARQRFRLSIAMMLNSRLCQPKRVGCFDLAERNVQDGV